jgi:excisionase family DNA binding protein
MNIREVAKYLFVSRVHVERLIERGVLTGALDESGQYVVDDASVERYCAQRERAAKEYFSSEGESDDPPRK